MRIRQCLAVLLSCVLANAALAAEKSRGLDIYFIDAEGGAATLLVTPQGESVLIDCGNPGSRDAERIHKAATEQAGLRAIDHFVATHWHTDHYGGVERLARLMPIRHYYDHGIPASLQEDPMNFPLLIQAYKNASAGKSRHLRPGDEIRLKQAAGSLPVRLVCLCSSGEVVPDKPGAPTNPVALEHKPMPDDPTDNAKSLGFLLSFGGFRFLDLGDLTWNIEYKLVHPTDKIGPIDVYQTTHHGLEISNNPVLIKTVRPRVAVYNNGPRKGAHPSVTATLRRVPGIQAIYQVHRNLQVGAQENTDPEFIANPDEQCRGESIRLSVTPDSRSYTVTVGSRGKPHRYETRGAAKEK
jgi:beta-lactamase superfamily II metal-dependent hydrolase